MKTIYILLILLAAFIAYSIITWLRQRKIVTPLDEDEFRKNYRRAQLIDVREPNEYEAGHILGARNIPLSQLKMRMPEIRKDQPIYFYDNSGTRSARAAQVVHKQGYEQLYYLAGGFKKWSGKIKTKK